MQFVRDLNFQVGITYKELVQMPFYVVIDRGVQNRRGSVPVPVNHLPTIPQGS